MAEEKKASKAKSEKTVDSKKSEKKTEKVVTKVNYANMTVVELRAELQKITLRIKVGEEPNTSLVSLVKRQIAKKLTKLNSETKAK